MNGFDSRVRVTFGVCNACVGVLLPVGLFCAVEPRFWALDVPIALVALVELASAVGLLTQSTWALRALSIAAWVTFVLGLLLVGAVVLSMAFLSGIHEDHGVAGLAVSGLIVALLVPYTLVLPALQLLWLKRVSTELAS